MQTIVYLCYGRDIHFSEMDYSLCSIMQFAWPDRRGPRIVVYTDDPLRLVDWDVEVVHLTPELLSEWVGPEEYVHRRKTMTIIDALRRYPGKIVFVDTDTYFKRDPQIAFDRVESGWACLHMAEASFGTARNHVYDQIFRLLANNEIFDTAGRPFRVDRHAVMWNSGVLGIHSDDAALMDYALTLIDRLWSLARREEARPALNIEQFVISYLLGKQRIRTCEHVVYHYWPIYQRDPFRAALPAILRPRTGETRENRVRRVMATRPRVNLLRRYKMYLRSTCRMLGLPFTGLRSSV